MKPSLDKEQASHEEAFSEATKELAAKPDQFILVSFKEDGDDGDLRVHISGMCGAIEMAIAAKALLQRAQVLIEQDAMMAFAEPQGGVH